MPYNIRLFKLQERLWRRQNWDFQHAFATKLIKKTIAKQFSRAEKLPLWTIKHS